MSEMTYLDAVESLFEMKCDAIIPNGMAENAADLFYCFFKFSQKNVNIFCHNVCDEVFDFDHVIKEFAMALKRGITIRIVTQTGEIKSKKLKAFIKENMLLDPTLKYRLEIYKGADHLKANFTTMDKRAYRFEQDAKNYVATASANRPDFAQKFDALFNQIIESAQRLSFEYVISH